MQAKKIQVKIESDGTLSGTNVRDQDGKVIDGINMLSIHWGVDWAEGIIPLATIEIRMPLIEVCAGAELVTWVRGKKYKLVEVNDAQDT